MAKTSHKAEGSGVTAQGPKAKATGKRGVIAKTVGANIITGDNNSLLHIINHYYLDQAKEVPDSTGLHRQIGSYLTWLQDRSGTIELRGIKREGQQVVQLDLETVYVPLAARAGGTRQIRLDQVLGLGERLIITGGPGSGKTTVLLHLAWTLTTALLTDNPDLTRTKLGITSSLPLPIFVPLSAYAAYVRQLPSGAAAQQRALAAFISYYLIEKQSSFDLPDDFFQRLLRDGQAVILLLDGLDEVPDEAERVRVRQGIEDLVTGRGGMRVAVTCRTAAYRERTALGKGFREVQVLPLAGKHIEAMVWQAYSHIYRSDPATGRDKTEELLQGIRDLEVARRRRLGEEIERLVISPLLVRMLLIVHFSERRLPDQRAELYMKATDAMLLPEYAPDEEIADRLGRLVGGSREIHRDLVQHLAFELHSQGEIKGREITEDELRQVLSSDPAYAGLVNDFITLTRLRGTLLEERLGVYRFIHLAFQEYLVARYLAEVIRSVEEIAAFLETGRLLDSWWREPALLVAGYLSMTSPRTAQALLRRLVTSAGRPEIQLAAVEVAGMALLEWPSFGETLHWEVAERLAGLFKNSATNQIPLSQRLSAGRVWGLLGYPGLTTLPPLLTPVIEGEFLYGEKKEQRSVAPFQAGVYPVTNAQFAFFIEAGGYENSAWWSQAGCQERQRGGWNQPRFWQDTQYNGPNQPVVGVSWYEAEAFCQWLSETYGQSYRLPREAEWERLARGQDGREYPWGDKWHRELANTYGSGIGKRSSPVGLSWWGESHRGLRLCR